MYICMLLTKCYNGKGPMSCSFPANNIQQVKFSDSQLILLLDFLITKIVQQALFVDRIYILVFPAVQPKSKRQKLLEEIEMTQPSKNVTAKTKLSITRDFE